MVRIWFFALSFVVTGHASNCINSLVGLPKVSLAIDSTRYLPEEAGFYPGLILRVSPLIRNRGGFLYLVDPDLQVIRSIAFRSMLPTIYDSPTDKIEVFVNELIDTNDPEAPGLAQKLLSSIDEAGIQIEAAPSEYTLSIQSIQPIVELEEGEIEVRVNVEENLGYVSGWARGAVESTNGERLDFFCHIKRDTQSSLTTDIAGYALFDVASVPSGSQFILYGFRWHAGTDAEVPAPDYARLVGTKIRFVNETRTLRVGHSPFTPAPNPF